MNNLNIKFLSFSIFSILTLTNVQAQVTASPDYFFDASDQPWYTLMTPRSIFKDNKTFVCFQHNSNLDPYVMAYDHSTNVWGNPIKVGESEIASGDSHGNHVMWFDVNNNMYVTYGSHSLAQGPQKVSKSSDPLTSGTWNNISPVEINMTYPQVHSKNNGDVLAYYRNRGHSISGQSSAPWIFKTSVDGGNTWSDRTKVLKSNDGDKYYFSLVDSENTLYITIVHESRPTVGRQDVYYVFLKDGKWFNQFNTELIKPSEGFGLSQLQILNCKVYDTGANATTAVPDIQVDAQNNLYLGIASVGSNDFVMGKRLGDNPFVFNSISDGCENWTDNVVLDVQNSNTITAYLNARGGVVEEWMTVDGGQNWLNQQDISTFGDAYSLQLVKNRNALAKLLFERRSDYTLYLWGSDGFVGRDTQTVRYEVENLTTVSFGAAENDLSDTNVPGISGSLGAREAMVGTFLLKMYRDCLSPEEQEILMDASNRVTTTSREMYEPTFPDLSATEKKGVMESVQEEAIAHELKKGNLPQFRPHSFYLLKRLTVRGYFTSKIGQTQARTYLPVPGKYEPCTPYHEEDKIWAT